jgi:carbon-monoxide dehydrogenase iron sulfur subunit
LKRIYAQESVCIGCRLCEVYCIAAHSPGGNLVKAFRQTERPIAAVRVQEDGALSFAMQCRHCDEPACLAACITGALERDERGVVTVNAEKCIGCWTCILACPYGAISRNEARRQSVKCDLCPGQDVPKCVAMCPNGALHYTETPPAFLVPKVG